MPSDAETERTLPTPPDSSVELLTRLRGVLAQQYVVEREIGLGGMARVFLATDRNLECPVAIKVLKPKLLTTPVAVERFRREAVFIARLRHPNIVSIHSLNKRDDLLYFVMDYVRGENLGEWLRRERPIPPADVEAVLIQVLAALDYAHARGIVHRDIKPENVLVDEETGRVLVADFGIARAVHAAQRLTGADVRIGTPPYMSPEQAAGDPTLDGRSDIYCLGVVGYEALTGHPPYIAKTPRDILERASRAIPDVQQFAPAVSRHMAGAVMRALQARPEDRWQHANDFSRALQGLHPVTGWRLWMVRLGRAFVPAAEPPHVARRSGGQPAS